MKEFFKSIINEKVEAPYHYASKHFFDTQQKLEPRYFYHSKDKELEEEYQKFQKDKLKLKPLIEITSKSLKLEYAKKLEYLNKNLRRLFFLSILILINTLMNLKFFGFSELYIATIILSALSITITLLLLFNIQTNVLLDLYGYSSFYLFSIFESIILIIIYILKIIDFYMIFKNKSKKGALKYFIIFLDIIIFCGIIIQIKYTFVSFCDAFNVLILKQKTTAQKQIELNEKKNAQHGDKIEFDDDDNDNDNDKTNRNLNSEAKLDTIDNLKTE